MLTEEILTPTFNWCRENKIDCLYFLAKLEDGPTIRLAENNGFILTDVKITLEIELDSLKPLKNNNLNSIRLAGAGDVEQLKQIASLNHQDSRFYYDGNFPIQKCNELFAAWIENSYHGLADVVLVAKSGDTVQGYITCLVDDNGTGAIGLVGVSENFKGLGIGKQLVDAALEWFKRNNVSTVTVVTQGRNIKAQRLYQRKGFIIASLHLWYHKWFHRN